MIKSQRGWTIWSVLGVGFLVVAGALLFMKLMPVYLDNYKIKEAMHSLVEDPRAADWSKRQIINEMTNILYIDYGHDIVDLNKALSVEKENEHKYIRVEYEVEVPLVYNISALVDFNNEVEVTR
ncbi:MAG: DUF4845 domain-containing protein [Gammaproteobacteria bacterium]|nr:DUF4845 domain-containing protein [Gammaproteobacteria bacterium]